MLGVKVTLSYLVLVGALVGIIVLLSGSTVGEMAREHTEQELRRAAVAAEQSARLDQAALLAKANFLSTGDRLYRSLKGEFVQSEEGEEGEPTVDPEYEGKRHLDAHEKLTAQKYRLEELTKSETTKRDMARRLLAREPGDLDIFLVVDHHGVGVAALGKDLYSWFGRDLSEEYPSIDEVAKGGTARVEYWMWAFKPGQEKRLHQVALAPIRRTDSEEPSGVLVLGFSVNDGVAKKKQQLVAGVSSDEAETELDSAPEFAFYRGSSIAGSTFSADRQAAVAAALGEAGLLTENPFQVGEVQLNGTPHLAMSRELSGGENPVGVAVVSNLAAARAPADQLRFDTVLVGVVFVLIGGILLFFFVVSFLKPIEELETGIQEVIAGNKDYHWESSGNDLQSSLAQGLNLMSAYLQGKPMPDDESGGSGWGDLMPPTGDQPQQQGPGEVQGVDLAALSTPPKKDEDDGES